jgi:hypothetical protein
VEREILLILNNLQEILTGKSKTKCMNSHHSRLGESSMETETSKLPNNSLQLWNKYYNNSAMKVPNLKCSLLKEIQ